MFLLTVLRFWVASGTQLAEDEAYYWLWARDLQLSYFDHPGMVAYWIAAGTAILGVTETGVRLFAILSAVATSWLVYDSARIAFSSEKTGFWSALWVNATILFGVGSVLITPDPPLLLFWMLCLWALLNLIETQKGDWWLVAGIALGVGIISKYTMVLLLPGVLLTSFLFPELRRWWARPQPYLAILLAFICSSPLLIWNYAHHWVSFDKQWSHAFGPHNREPIKWLGEFLGSQVGLITPFIFLLTLWGMGWALLTGWLLRRPAWFLLGMVSLPVFLFFLEHTLTGSVQAHWAGPAYLGGIIAAVGGLSNRQDATLPGRVSRGWLIVAPSFGMLLTIMVYIQALHPFLPMAQRLDPTHRLAGWSQLGKAIDAERQRYPDAFLFTQIHNITGTVSFYTQGHPKVFQVHNRIRYPYIHDDDVAALPGKTGIYVTKADADDADSLASSFAKWTPLDEITLVRAGQPFGHYRLYLGQGFKGGLFGE